MSRPSDSIRPAPGNHLPLLVIALVGLVVAFAIAKGYGGAVGMTLHAWMGFVLVALALLKLLDLEGFADAFSKYDLIARRWRPYAFVYPFAELALGLAYFAFVNPPLVYVATTILFTFNAASMLTAIDRRRPAKCVRMGAAFAQRLTPVVASQGLVIIAMSIVLLAL